jgi:dihydrofolate reductase
MRKVIYSPMVSLDGVINGPDGGLDWGVIDEELYRFVNEQQREIDTHLYGRRMYEAMVYWETVDQDSSQPDYVLEFARIWKALRKVVFSSTLERVQGNARLVREDMAQEIARLKAQPGQDMEIGGASIAASAMRLGLIDEYRPFVHPAVVGGGTPVFPAPGGPVKLRLVETHTFGSGVVYLCYQADGKEP